MWLLAALLACGGAEAPAASVPDPHAPRTVPVGELPQERVAEANGLTANKLLGALLGQDAAVACLAPGGTEQLDRIGFTLMEASGPLELIVSSGSPKVDACLQGVHQTTDYSPVVVPVPFEVETSLARP